MNVLTGHEVTLAHHDALLAVRVLVPVLLILLSNQLYGLAPLHDHAALLRVLQVELEIMLPQLLNYLKGK